MNNSVFMPADILVPADIDMEKWSVIACDQFSSEPRYWEDVKEFVGTCPSTLHMIIPEAYLESMTNPEDIRKINQQMDQYLNDDLFRILQTSLIYVERTLSDGHVRRGLVGAIDLEVYDFSTASCSPIRASENTIIARLPPRIKVRKEAALEIPHIMTLIDDKEMTVIEPISKIKDQLEKVYDFPLMEEGGAIRGWRVCGDQLAPILEALKQLGLNSPVQILIGDGNHSLATAKASWEEMKTGLNQGEMENHPARFSLVELNNVYDPAIEFEAIHRVVFGVDPKKLLRAFADSMPMDREGGYEIRYTYKNGEGKILIPSESIGDTIGILQTFLDDYVKQNGGCVDYIHGEDSVLALSKDDGALGFILPSMGKSDFFATVIQSGVFPKKSFSIGHARDKRYYLECRKIK